MARVTFSRNSSQTMGGTPTHNGFSNVSSGKRGGSGSSMGGNLGGNESSAVSATGATSRQGVPAANSDPSQIGNTLQQSLPSLVAAGGFLALGIISSLNAEYEKMVDISERYYQEFVFDRNHWTFTYAPHIRDRFVPMAVNEPVYFGDGRGQFNTQSNPDLDLFRRAQLAGQHIAQMDIAWRTKRRVVGRYSHGEMRMDDLDISIKRAQLQTDNQIIARKIEDIREDEFNNRRWNRLIQAANIGIAGTNIATQGYSTAMAGHMDALQGMANYKTSLGNQISAAAGNYLESRGDN